MMITMNDDDNDDENEDLPCPAVCCSLGSFSCFCRASMYDYPKSSWLVAPLIMIMMMIYDEDDGGPLDDDVQYDYDD